MDGLFYLLETMRRKEEKLENDVFFWNCPTLSIWEGTNKFYKPCPARVIFYQITCYGYLEVY